MPIYEYKCENAHVFDVLQKISDEPLTTCPECGGLAKKLMSPVGISFKGSGFYATDYARRSSETTSSESKNGKEGSSDAGGKDSSGTSKEGSSDTGQTPSETGKGGSSEGSSKGSSEGSSKKEE